MSLALFVYFAGVTGSLKGLFFGTCFVAGLISLAMFVYAYLEEEKLNWKLPATLCFVCAVLCVFTPEKDTVYLMGAAYASEKVYDSEMGQDTVKLLHLKIKEQIKAIEQPTQPARK